MSCPPELELATYVDAELAPEARRGIETHLIGCEACRARVVALREEAELLSDALWERDRSVARLPSRPAGARGLAFGAGPALVATALVAGVLGWLLEARWLPAGTGWLVPFVPGGLSDMAFDLAFLLRDEAPALLALFVAGAATLSISAILSFVLTLVLRRWTGPGALALGLALLATPTPGQAHLGLHSHEDFVLAAGEVHDGTLLLSGRRVDIDGTVNGDLIVMTERLTVRGEVRGNLLAVARSAEVAGSVRGSVGCLCRDLRLEGTLESDLYAASHEVRVAHGGRVARNLSAGAEDVVVEGSVGRDLLALAEHVELRGSVGRDVHSWRSRLSLRDAARVGRDVEARLEETSDLDVAPGARIAGELRTQLAPRLREARFERFRRPGFYLLHAILLAGALLVGLLAQRFLPRLFEAGLHSGTEFFRTLGLGALTLIAAPAALGVAALSLVGMPLALMGLGALLAGLYLSAVVVAAWLGTSLVGPREGASGFGLALLVGLLVLFVLTHLPFVGIPARLLAVLTGLGLIVRRLRPAPARSA